MTINTENMVSITETNQNFSKVAKEEFASTDEALASAKKLIKKHLPAFQELAK